MFWNSTVISGASIILNALTYIIPFFIDKFLILLIFFLASTFLVLYSVFSVILLVGTTMRYGLYTGFFKKRGAGEEQAGNGLNISK